jgi:tRNA (adenine37-N6)-methyltransferase
MDIIYHPIGVIHSPFHDLKEMPIQPTSASSAAGWIEIDPQYAEGLKDVEGFSHIILLYHLHQVKSTKLTVTPFLDSEKRGVFATRAPSRPNPIGLSVVKLERVDGNRLEVGNIDILDGTPLLDIKPYVSDFDKPDVTRNGWLEAARGKVKDTKSDERFR